LRKLYERTDALHAHFSCDASTDCCHFGVTGREPYPTAVELAELELALASAPMKKRRSLELAEHRRCPVLGDDGRCRAYAARPFGCRTYFCARARGAPVDRAEVQHIARAIAALSARFAPRDPGPRPLSSALRSRA
jgi:Fe-S-cluster containining protein